MIVPDIHLKWKRAEEAIREEGPDQIIFLGDYFDDFDDTPLQNFECAVWLRKSLEDPKRIHLFGNHDLMYAYPTRSLRCSGYSDDKYTVINTELGFRDWSKLKFHVWLDDWLLTHAGLDLSYLPRNMKIGKKFKNWLVEEEAKAHRALNVQEPHWFYGAGQARGGRYPTGGIVWCDYLREFQPIPGLKQIFGHTPVTWVPRVAEEICLDTHLNHYALYKKGKMEIKPMPY